MRLLFISITLLISISCSAQEAIKDTTHYSRHTITGGIGMETLFYLQYKYKFYNSRYLQSNVLGGFGSSPGDEEGDLPAYRTISLGVCQSVAIRPIFLTVGVVPMFNFYDHVTYTTINGLIGLSYQAKKPDPSVTFELGYFPQLFTSHEKSLGPSFYVGMGLTF